MGLGIGMTWSCSPTDKVSSHTLSELLLPNPNPKRFQILESEFMNGNTILLVLYPDCTTYGGKKLLLLKGMHTEFKELDPHFLNDNHPVIARFIPDEDGYAMALASAKVY